MKKYITGVITGLILALGLTVLAATLSSSISFTTDKNSNIHTVEEALNDLYSKSGSGLTCTLNGSKTKNTISNTSIRYRNKV